MKDNEKPCPVPECEGGYIRLPVLVERSMYGTYEKFVRFQEHQCFECYGTGVVPE